MLEYQGVCGTVETRSLCSASDSDRECTPTQAKTRLPWTESCIAFSTRGYGTYRQDHDSHNPRTPKPKILNSPTLHRARQSSAAGDPLALRCTGSRPRPTQSTALGLQDLATSSLLGFRVTGLGFRSLGFGSLFCEALGCRRPKHET